MGEYAMTREVYVTHAVNMTLAEAASRLAKVQARAAMAHHDRRRTPYPPDEQREHRALVLEVCRRKLERLQGQLDGDVWHGRCEAFEPVARHKRWTFTWTGLTTTIPEETP